MSENYFALFGLLPVFNIDLQLLETNYRKLQSEMHPDRFVSGTTAEKLHSMQIATLANEAYSVLKSPAQRATYLLSLHGIHATSESNTQMPPAFLMQAMEWREAIEDATHEKNINALDNINIEMLLQAKKLQSTLVILLDEEKALQEAEVNTRKLIFIDKITADIHKAIEQLEN